MTVAARRPLRNRSDLNLTISEGAGTGERLDMLCGRFIVKAPHDRLISQYLPRTLLVRSREHEPNVDAASAANQLQGLVHLMKLESFESRLGGFAMLNALSAALPRGPIIKSIWATSLPSPTSDSPTISL